MTPAERETIRAERRQVKTDRLADWAASRQRQAAAAFGRADSISSMIPFGQPILVGHHSERRHRRDLDRIDRAMSAGVESARMAEQHASRAERIRAFEEERLTGPVVTRRIERLEAECRQIERNLAGELRYVGPWPPTAGAMRDSANFQRQPPSEPWRRQLESRKTKLDADIAYWREQLAALTDSGAYRTWTRADFAKGDRVRATDGQVYRVMRVNAKSLSVPSPLPGAAWTNTLPYDRVKDKLDDNADGIDAATVERFGTHDPRRCR